MNKYDFALLLTAIMWGLGYIAVDLTLEQVPTFSILFIRFFCSALIIFLIVRRQILKYLKITVVPGLILGIFLALAFIFQTFGLTFTSASNNAFITATNVVMVPILLKILFKNKLQKKIIVSAVLMVFGIALVSGVNDFTFNLGDFLTLISALFFALHIIYIERFVNSQNLLSLVFLQQFFAAIICLFFALITNTLELGNLNLVIYPLLYVILIATLLTFFLQNYAINKTESSKAAIILSSEAFFATIGAILILDETLNISTIIGFILMFCAIIISQVSFKKIKK